MIGRVNVGGGGEVGPTYTIKKWCATVGYDYANLDDIPETAMRILMTKYASVAYFMEWYSADNSMIDAFIASATAMKWIGLRDYICDKLMNYGTINLLKPTLETTTTNGVTCTNNGDGTYTLSGTASSDTQFVIGSCDFNVGEYKVVGCPSGGSVWNSYLLYTIGVGVNGIDVGNGNIFTISESSTKTVAIWLKSGLTYNLRFKPMLTTNLEATYSDFIQYGHSEIGDKMLGSEYWEYILKDHVPIMTSDSAPYGSCSASSTYSGYNAYKAFDNDSSTSWVSYDETQPSIIYNFTNPTKINAISEIPYYSSYFRVKGFTVSGSNDGNTWTPIYSGVSAESNTEQFFKFANENYYMMCKVQITSEYASLSSSGKGFTKLQFYGRSLNVSVPTMISNTSPYGEVKTSSAYTSDGTTYAGYLAFDGIHTSTVATNWCSNLDIDTSPWIYYDFKKPIVATRATMLRHDGHRSLKGKFQASNTGNDGDWIDLTDEVTIYYTASGAYNYAGHLYGMEFEFNTDHIAYKMYKFQVTDGSTVSSAITQIAKLQFFGVDYSERTDRTYLYDHGVELVDFSMPSGTCRKTDGNYTNNVAFTKESNRMISSKLTDVTFNSSIIATTSTLDFTPYSNIFARMECNAVNGVESFSVANINESAYVVFCLFYYDSGKDLTHWQISRQLVGFGDSGATIAGIQATPDYTHNKDLRWVIDELWLE